MFVNDKPKLCKYYGLFEEIKAIHYISITWNTKISNDSKCYLWS